jgi:ATP-dependent Zn protease
MSTESFSPERHEQTGVSPDIRFITDLEGVLDLTYQAEPNQFIYLSSDMAPPIRSFGIRVEGSNEAFGPYYFRGEAHMLPAEDKDAYLEQAFHNFAESREARSVDNEEMPTYIYRSNGDKIYIVYLDPQTQDIGLISCGTYQEGVDLTQQAQNALHHGIDDENNALVDFLAEQKQLLVELYRSFGLAVKPQRLIIAPCETGDKHEAKPGRKKVLFSDLAGLREVKEQLREILLALQHPEVLQLWGAERPNGILLHGPGGTGKTTLVEAFSNEAGAELITVKANEVYDSLMGQSEKGFMAVINRVLAATRPTILFFDEIDAFLRPRAGGAYTNVVGLYKQ